MLFESGPVSWKPVLHPTPCSAIGWAGQATPTQHVRPMWRRRISGHVLRVIATEEYVLYTNPSCFAPCGHAVHCTIYSVHTVTQ